MRFASHRLSFNRSRRAALSLVAAFVGLGGHAGFAESAIAAESAAEKERKALAVPYYLGNVSDYNDLYEKLAWEGVYDELWSNHPGLSKEQLQKLFIDARANYAKKMTANVDRYKSYKEYVELVLESLEVVVDYVAPEDKKAKAAVKGLKVAVKWADKLTGYQGKMAAKDRWAVAQHHGSYYSLGLDHAVGVVQGIVDKAAEHPDYAKGRLEALGYADVRASKEAMLASNPALHELAQMKAFQALLNNDEQIKHKLKLLWEAQREGFDTLIALNTQALEDIKKLDAKLNIVVVLVAREELRRQAEKRAAERQETLAAVRSGFYLLSLLLAPVDGKAARDIQVLGAAGVQVATSFEAIAAGLMAALKPDEKGNRDFSKFFNAGTLVATGNMVQATMTLASLFAGGSSPEDQIAEQLGALRQDVAKLGVAMHERFDRVDYALNRIYGEMLAGFERISEKLTEIHGAVADLHTDLRGLGEQLAGLEDVLGAEARRVVVRGIDRAESDNSMTLETFKELENLFYSWADVHAFDDAATGGDNRPVDDADLLIELRKSSVDRNLKYLGAVAVENFGLANPFDDAAMNPVDWALGAGAYAQLISDWPEYARRMKVGPRLARIAQHGERLRKGLAATAVQDETDASLLRSAVRFYRQKLDAVRAQLEQIHRSQVENTKLDPFGGKDQPLIDEDVPQPPAVARCDGQGPEALSTPEPNHTRWMFPPGMLVGQHLKRNVDLCFSARWTGNVFDYGDGYWESYIAIKLHIRYKGLDVHTREATAKTLSTQTWSGAPVSPYASAPHRWDTDLKARITPTRVPPFSDVAIWTHPSGDALGSAQTTNTLADQRERLAQSVLLDAQGGELATRLRELGGAKALVETVTGLALPGALSHDDELRGCIYGEDRFIDNEPAVLVRAFEGGATPAAPSTIGRISDYFMFFASQSGGGPSGGPPGHTIPNITQQARWYNFISAFSDKWQTRASDCAGIIEAYIGEISAKQYADSPWLVDDTLAGLRLARRAAQLDSEVDPGGGLCGGGIGALGPLAGGLLLMIRRRRGRRSEMVGYAQASSESQTWTRPRRDVMRTGGGPAWGTRNHGAAGSARAAASPTRGR